MAAELDFAGTIAATAPSRAPASVADAADAPICWLIDNADAYDALLAACRSARESIWMTQLAFDADCIAYDAAGGDDIRIADVLAESVMERGVDVRILLNASLLLDTAKPLRAHYAAAGVDSRKLRIRGISRFPQLLHAKVVVVDGEVAFLVGSPFANGYWDDSRHAPVDARRPPRELGGRPLHDLSVRVTGGAASQLSAAFAELWNGADDVVAGDVERLEITGCRVDEGVQIVRSAPRPRRAGHPRERTSILRALLAGIASAERLIYIEHQYLSSVVVIAALSAALERQPALEIIVVLNQNPDVTAYRGWQNLRLAASGLFDHPRVGLFSLWTLAAGDAGGRPAINQVFVHSKVVAVDDRWAMVGSANLDGVSLQTYGDDFSGRLGQRVFRGVRNFDVAAIVSGATSSVESAAVFELRSALWREHLDTPDLDAATVPPGGWLAHWRRRAAEHAAMLGSVPSSPEAQIILLPYSRQSTPVRQLCDAGVPFANREVEVCFNPSWVEVHLSPNWMRNMFA